MIQVLHLSSRWNKFLVSSFISIQFFFPWVAGCHLIIWDVFHKTISRLFFSLLVFQQLRSSICCYRALSRSCFTSFIPFHSFFYSGGIVMLLSATHHLVCQRSCSFRAYPFNQSVVSSAQVLFILSSLVSLFNRSAVRIWSSLIPFLNRRVFNIYLPFNLKVSQCSLSLVSNGVFSTLFSFVLFFSRISSTSQGSLVSLVRQRSNFVLPLLSLFPPVPF